jgi:hypothetical protein
MFIDYHAKGFGMVWFDEEGTEFTVVLTPYSLFIIEEKDKPILHDFSEIKIDKLEKELIEDIEKDLNGWALFSTDFDREEIIQHKNEIRERLTKLKSFQSE